MQAYLELEIYGLADDSSLSLERTRELGLLCGETDTFFSHRLGWLFAISSPCLFSFSQWAAHTRSPQTNRLNSDDGAH